MAYQGIIKVETSKLTSTAREFSTSAETVNRITQNMLSKVNSTCSGVWKGNASNMYRLKFGTLQDDMRRMYKMFMEHCKDLQEMARNYEQAEQSNTSKFGRLQEDPVQ